MRLFVPVVLSTAVLAVTGLSASAVAQAPTVTSVAVGGSGPGDLVRATATGFVSDVAVSVTLVGTTTSNPLVDVTADDAGTVTLPAATRIPVTTVPGAYRLTMTAGGTTATSPVFAIVAPRVTFPSRLIPGVPGTPLLPAATIKLAGLANSADVVRTVTIDGAVVPSQWSHAEAAFTYPGIGVGVPATLAVGDHTVTFTQTGATPFTASATMSVAAPRVTVPLPVAPTARVEVDVDDTGWADVLDVTVTGAAGDRHTAQLTGSESTSVHASIDVAGVSVGHATLTAVSRHNGATASTTVTVDPATVAAPGGLAPGQRVVTADGDRELVMQTDGNLVERAYGRYAEWSTRTQGHPGARLTVQTDGNVVVRDTGGRALWTTGTNGIGTGARFGFDRSSQPAVFAASGREAWSSFVPFGGQLQERLDANGYLFKGQSLSANLLRGPGGAVYLSVQDDGGLVVRGDHQGVLWSAHTQGHPNAYLSLQTDGNLVLRAANGAALWADGVRGVAGARVVAQSDGNVVEYAPNGRALWSTRTHV